MTDSTADETSGRQQRPCGEVRNAHGGHQYMLGARVYDCPGGQPSCDSHEPSVDAHDASVDSTDALTESCDHDSQVIEHEGVDYWACLKCGKNHGRADDPAAPDARRAQYAAAIVTAYLGPADGCTDRMTTAAMAVADREQQQLREQLRDAEQEVTRQHHDCQQAEHRLRLAHQARRAKEHQLDDIRRALCDTGHMDDGDPYSHADLADVIRDTEPEPNPPGSTREQLPDHLLALIRPEMPNYLSTACSAGQLLAAAIPDHPGHATELDTWLRRMHQRCRRNHKFTGQLCCCDCHTDALKEPRL